jgi:hypothetical protein
MITAADDGRLIDVMDSWRARQRWAETGNTRTHSDLDDTAKTVCQLGSLLVKRLSRSARR